jgi:protein-S-isoprenylcysteine O-methyltransferase Ste14
VIEEGSRRKTGFDLLIAVVLPAGVIAAIYLTPFVSDPSTMPFGVDTSTYIWRTNVVHDLGIASLIPEATNAPKPLGDRPGYPLVLSLLRSATGLSSLSLMWLTPALFSAALGLAAGSLASDGALERRGRSGAIAVAVGGSAFVAWTAVGYAANLALDVVAMAAAVMALEVARGRRGVWAGAVLVAGAVLLHWMFALLFVAIIGVVAVIRSVRFGDERDRSPRATFTRLARMLAIGTVVGAIALLLLAPQRPTRLPEVDPSRPGPARRVEHRLPALALPVTIPLAALGSALLVFDRRRRNAGVLLGIWSSLALISLVAWFILELPLPPYRWAGFALGIPAAIVLGAFAAGDLFARRGRRLFASLAIAGALAAAVGLVGAGASVWWSLKPTLVAYEFGQLRTLSSYVESLPPRTRIVILIKAYRKRAPFNRAWTELPADRLPFVTMVPAKIKEHAPDLGLPPEARERAGTVVVSLDAYREPPGVGRSLGPGVHLIFGPDAEAFEVGAPPRAPPPLHLAASVVVLLGLLSFSGGGWAASLTDLPGIGVVSVAPAFGVAILISVGLLASRAGVPLHAPWGTILVAVVGIAGWGVALVQRRRPSVGEDRTGYGSSSALGPSW